MPHVSSRLVAWLTTIVAAAAVAAVPASAAQDNSPAPVVTEAAAQPAFRSRQDFTRGASAVPPVIPIVRAPDDPGIDDEPETDEFAEPTEPARSQAGGWRGFFSRWGG